MADRFSRSYRAIFFLDEYTYLEREQQVLKRGLNTGRRILKRGQLDILLMVLVRVVANVMPSITF